LPISWKMVLFTHQREDNWCKLSCARSLKK
jgi:hypothetical protein